MPSASSSASRSARLDAEIPTTATMAAIPMAMPSAVNVGPQPPGAQPDRADRHADAGAHGSPRRLREARARGGRVCRAQPPPPRDVVDHPPVEQRDPAGARAAISRSWVISTMVRPSRVEIGEQLTMASPVAAVEVAGRFVGEHDRRIADEGAGDRHPLALAARQRARAVAGPRRESDRRRAPRGAAAMRRRRGTPAYSRPSATFSSAVSRSTRWNCWNTKPMRRPRTAAEPTVAQRARRRGRRCAPCPSTVAAAHRRR